jgi:flagellar assembly protein FliH
MSPRVAPLKKFLFDRSFDDPAKLYLPGERRKSEQAAAEVAEAATQAAPPPAAPALDDAAPEPEVAAKPEFTQSQLDAAREEGYIAGHTAALDEAATAREHYVADAMNLIAQNLDKLEENQRTTNLQLADVAMRMVYGVAQRLLPRFAQAHAVDSIEHFVREVLPLAVGEPRLAVRAHPMIAPDLEERLKAVFERASFQGSYHVITDYELQPGDCRLEWDGGGVERDEGRIWRDIREVIAGTIGDVDVDALDKAADAVIAQDQNQTPASSGDETASQDETSSPQG